MINQKCDNCGTLNGTKLDGIKLNDSNQDGDDLLSQTSVRADSATGLTLNGEALVGLTLRGSEIRSTRQSDGAVLRGDALIGAAFYTTTFEGDPITLRRIGGPKPF